MYTKVELVKCAGFPSTEEHIIKKKNLAIALLISVILLTAVADEIISSRVFAAASSSTTNTFGYSSVGMYYTSSSSKLKISCSFQAPQTGTITSISMYIQVLQSTAQVAFGVYSDLNGVPNQLLGQSSLVSAGTGYNWVTASVTAPVTAGQTYWLTMAPTSTVYWTYDFGGLSEETHGTGGLPLSTNFGTYVPSEPIEISIYATYSTPPPSTPAPTPSAASTPNPTSTPTPSPSSSPSSVQIGVYSNSGCTTAESSISWGQIAPGGTNTVTVYVRNLGTQSVTLALSLTNVNPTGLSSYLTLKWNYAGQTLAASASLAVTLSLTVAASVSGVSSFSFNTVIAGTST